jgi:NAD(P)-dependent dehydrogenase (short-subunit alcohol dehydrogenase family)
MAYFVTGGTGFIGRRLIARLAAHEVVYVLVREGSRARFEAQRSAAGQDPARVVAVTGDISAPALGVAAPEIAALRGGIRHVYHLAALYDITAAGPENAAANVAGTGHALDFAAAVGCGCFHHVSSIAAAGLYSGTFTEAMFDEATGLEHPYFRTKHDGEARVRAETRFAWRIYRPGMVVGDSATGAIDKIDGPYYFFKLLQKLRSGWPSWLPLVGLEGGWANLVPVDFVVRALEHLSQLPGHDGECFHLTDPRPRRLGEVLNVFAKAAHAPQATIRIDPKLIERLPPDLAAVAAFEPVRRIVEELLDGLAVPREALGFLNYPTRFDCERTSALLAPAGIRVPPLEDYAWRLWDYWERHLDPDLSLDRSLGGAVRDKIVLITGGSSGIGRASAIRIADAGGKVLLVARDPVKLEEVRALIAARGGTVHCYPGDLTDASASSRLIGQALAEHGRVDILVNNAGRSIRRGIREAYDRFHDYERVMQLNYFATVRLTLAVLPSMVARGAGHIVNISSISALANPPRFSAYTASKAALEGFTRCAAGEFAEAGIAFTIINMPLVRTPMIAPTRIYEQMPTIAPEEAADLVAEAVIRRLQRPDGQHVEDPVPGAPERVDERLRARPLDPDDAHRQFLLARQHEAADRQRLVGRERGDQRERVLALRGVEGHAQAALRGRKQAHEGAKQVRLRDQPDQAPVAHDRQCAELAVAHQDRGRLDRLLRAHRGELAAEQLADAR